MREYKTERGITIGIVPIPLLLDEIRKANAGPERPTYTEHLAGGATQEITITEADAAVWQKDNPDSWAEHAEKWAAYERERDTAQEQLNDRIWLAVMRQSIQVELPRDDTWIREQQELGLLVPDDPRERRIHYIRTEVVGGMRDILRITSIANGTDLSEEVLSLAEASFRNSLARRLLTGLADQAGAVAAGQPSGTDASSKGMGEVAE